MTSPSEILPLVAAGTTQLQRIVREAVTEPCHGGVQDTGVHSYYIGAQGFCRFCNSTGYVLRSPYGDPERDAAAMLAVVCLALDGYDPDLARHIYLIGADDIDGAWEAVKAALESEATHG